MRLMEVKKQDGKFYIDGVEKSESFLTNFKRTVEQRSAGYILGLGPIGYYPPDDPLFVMVGDGKQGISIKELENL